MWLLQMRYAAGTKDVLDRFFNNKPLKKDDVIVEVSHLFLCPSICSCALWDHHLLLASAGSRKNVLPARSDCGCV